MSQLPALAIVPPPPLSFPGTVHLAQLLPYHGRRFVQVAYQAILRHPPDPQGERSYLSILERRGSRIEVLFRLRFSAEGRSHKVRVPGLFLAAAGAGLLMVPGLGYILRLVGRTMNLPGWGLEVDQRLADVQNFAEAQRTELTTTLRDLQEIVHTQDRRIRELEKKLEEQNS